MKSKGLSGSALKWIALVSMALDHFGAVFYVDSWFARRPLLSRSQYFTLRFIGRLAFPIYCFLLVEGYRHTRSVKKYLLRLLLFGLASELPFDLAVRHAFIDWKYQNVFFTLFFGLLAIALWDWATERDPKSCGPWRFLLGLGCIAAATAAAELAKTDYGAWGVLTIAALYLFRESEWQRDLFSGCALVCASPLEAWAFVDYLLLHFYNGQRGRQIKYLFYLFYPLHFLLYALISRKFYPY